MAVTVHCPNPACARAATVAETALGRQARCPGCGQPFVLSADAAPPPEPNRSLPASVGRFRVRARLGAGAFGTVYRAYDPHLDREVALKVPHPEVRDSPIKVERFLREAKAAAQLRHPCIVPVFDAGQQDGVPYIASAFVAGQPLADLVEEGGLAFRRAARLVRDLAEAAAYAHGQGIVHRDLKPANVLVDAQDRPHLLDFGLAARRDSAEKLTNDGAILGTPAYMAPEQAGGQQGEARPAGDQYSLGALLYELLCGRTPFEGPPAIVLFHALNTAPPAPRGLRPGLPRDLETVCLKALAKRPEDRYPDCQALADDLRRWLDGEPVAARRLGPVGRLARWARREPVVAGLATAVMVVLLAGVAVSSYFAVRADRERTRAVEQAARADQKATEAEESAADAHRTKRAADKRLYLSHMLLAQRAWEDNQIGWLIELLEGQRPERTGGADLRGFEWHYWWHMTHGHRKALRGHAQLVTSVAFSPDGKYLASSSIDKTVRLWNAETGTELHTFTGHTDPVWSVAFSRDGKYLASGSADKTVRVWEARTGKPLHSLTGHAHEVLRVAFSPATSKQLASSSADRAVRVWDAETGSCLHTLTGHADWVRSVAFSPDGNRLASSSADKTVRLWEAQTGKPLHTLAGHTNGASNVAYSPDGKYLASGSEDNKTVLVWDAETGTELHALTGHTALVSSVAFSPDGKHIASGSWDNTVRTWDAQAGKGLLTLTGHTKWVSSVAFSPDGKRLASGGFDGAVRVWDAETGQETLTLKGHTRLVRSVAFSPSGHLIASGSADGTLRLWGSTLTP